MTKRIDDRLTGHPGPTTARVHRTRAKGQLLLGWIGVALAAPFFIWALLAVAMPIPSMVDVFGIVGLRIPASITVGGLLLAAIGFHRF